MPILLWLMVCLLYIHTYVCYTAQGMSCIDLEIGRGVCVVLRQLKNHHEVYSLYVYLNVYIKGFTFKSGWVNKILCKCCLYREIYSTHSSTISMLSNIILYHTCVRI